jgi:chromosome segregation ATPase
MSDTSLIDCNAVLDTFRQWQTAQAPIDAELSESLSALAAYQSHLDEWQQQLAREREELHSTREQWERQYEASRQDDLREAADAVQLSSARNEIAELTAKLENSEQERQAAHERFELEIAEVKRESSASISSLAAAELDAARLEIENLTLALNARADEQHALREQHEQDLTVAESNSSRLSEVTEELTAARAEIANLTKCLLTSADELRAERQKIEHTESAADHHQSRLSELTTELSAARDKISALTTMLLSRTEELRTLDVRRAEANAELELARVRERELVATLEELRQTREWEHAQWADDSRHLREMVERRLEGVDPEYGGERAAASQSLERREPKTGERAEESPVFTSVKEQFGKLRQQRAMDRPASKKAR